MGQLIVNYKYRIGQVVYFMYNNEVRKGIVARIEIWANAKPLATHLTKKIVNKITSIFDKDYPFEEPNVRYSLDLVSKSGDFESAPHLKYEYDVYETKSDILNKLKV